MRAAASRAARPPGARMSAETPDRERARPAASRRTPGEIAKAVAAFLLTLAALLLASAIVTIVRGSS